MNKHIKNIVFTLYLNFRDIQIFNLKLLCTNSLKYSGIYNRQYKNILTAVYRREKLKIHLDYSSITLYN